MDLWRGRISPRRMAVLIAALPPDSATRQAQNSRRPLWTTTDYLLADVYDAVRWLNWTIIAQQSKRRPDIPVPYPRPGEGTRKTEITTADLLDFAERTRKRL